MHIGTDADVHFYLKFKTVKIILHPFIQKFAPMKISAIRYVATSH